MILTLKWLASVILPCGALWKRLLNRALDDAQGETRLAFLLFSKWVEVRYSHNPRLAIRALTWARHQLDPNLPSILKGRDAPTTTKPPRAGDRPHPSPAHKGVDH